MPLSNLFGKNFIIRKKIMQSIINYALKCSNKIIGFILLLLGFSMACSEVACEYGSPIVEYGTPHATFIVKGKVRSNATEQVIPSIRVVINYDTVYTNENGDYEVRTNAFPTDQSFLVEFDDIDETQNGQYEALDTTVEFVDPQFTGGDGEWYDGETEKELQIRMKPRD